MKSANFVFDINYSLAVSDWVVLKASMTRLIFQGLA